LFENPTVSRLADAVTRLQIETIGEPEMEKILDRLEDMTEEEAALLLNQLDG